MQKKRILRKKRVVPEDEDNIVEEVTADKMQSSLRVQLLATKMMQQQRARHMGTDTGALANSKHTTVLEESVREGGGELLDSFSKEQLRSDTDIDSHMHNFVEEQLAKRFGRFKSVVASDALAPDPEEELYSVPAELQVAEGQNADPLGAWTTSIAEVPLPLDYKLANIEDTEAAKRKLLEASASDSDDDDGDGKAGEPSLQRGGFPHGFGRKSAKELDIRENAILKAKDMAFRRKR